MAAPLQLQGSHATVRAATLEVWRLIKYGVVGLSNIAVSLAVMNLFFFFVHPTSPQMLVLGSSVGYLAGDVNSYWWNRGFTFGLPRATRRSALRFAAVSLAAMSINAGMVWGYSDLLLHSFLPVWLQTNLSQVSATISGGIGYVACRVWVFRTTGTM